MREREGLIARIRHLRRVRAAADDPLPADASAGTARAEATRIDALESRIAHLERQLEGLQDSVHRESDRHGKLIADLQAQLQPSALAAALSKDARERGLS
jgi:uncharacterized coiled-coil protein SlyX